MPENIRWLCLLPPLLSIGVALIFKRIYLGLSLGVLLGVALIAGFGHTNYFILLASYLIDVFRDNDKLFVLIFSLFIAAMVALITLNGGMSAVVSRLSAYAKTRRQTLFMTWFMGVIIFFDDYANTLVVGNAMRPVCDAKGISREKLAYIVDSTAAPIAAIAFVTTWVGTEMTYLAEVSEGVGMNISGVSFFLSSLKYAFYPVFTLVFILLLIGSSRDFGPMLAAERKARDEKLTENMEGQTYGSKPWFALIPIALLLLGTLGFMLFFGMEALGEASGTSFADKVSMLMDNSKPMLSLLLGASLSMLSALAITLLQKHSFRNSSLAMYKGAISIGDALLILVLAWMLSAVIKDLQVGQFLQQHLTGAIDPRLFPAIIFVIAGLVAFSTGSSWSTMGILYPTMLPLVWYACKEVGLGIPETFELMYHSGAVVLAGSVLGDHCSPISDTTILSSMASSCDHLTHVKTQMPYALVVGAVSVIASLVGGFGLMPWYLIYLGGIILLFLSIKILGKKVQV